MPQFPLQIGEITGHGFRFVFGHPGAALRLGAFPLTAWIAINTASDWADASGYNVPTIVLIVLPQLCVAWFSLMWHRYHLLRNDIETPTKFDGSSPQTDPRIVSQFFARTVGFFVMFGLAVAVPFFLLLMLAPRQASFEALGVQVVVLITAVVLAVTPVMVRILPALPAAAVGMREIGFGAAWKLTEGNTARYSAIAILVHFPWIVATAVIAYLILTIPILQDTSIPALVAANVLIGIPTFGAAATAVICNGTVLRTLLDMPDTNARYQIEQF